MSATLTVDQINKLDDQTFIKLFGNIVEHYPAIAIALNKIRPFKDAFTVAQAAEDYLNSVNFETKKKILQLYPDLAGKLADEGKLGKDSEEEHKSAGLDKLTPTEKEEMQTLNEKYKAKFDFPFVICARQNKVPTIIAGLKNRLQNETDTEIATGIEEVKKICALRIFAIVQ